MVTTKMTNISIFLTVMWRPFYSFLLSETLFKCNFQEIQSFTFKVKFSKFSIVPFFSNDFRAPSDGPETLKIFLSLKNSFLSQNLMSVIWKGRYLAVICYFLGIFLVERYNNVTKKRSNGKINKTKIITG